MALLAWLAFVPAALIGVGAGADLAQTTTADTAIGSAASVLRQEAVYVEPGAEGVVDEDQLSARIRDAGVAAKVAVFTTETITANGGPDVVLRELIDQTGIGAAYAVVGPRTFRSGPPGRAAEAGTAAFNQARDGGPAAVAVAFVDQLAGASGASGGTGREGRRGAGDGGRESGGSLMPFLLVGGAVAGGVWLVRSSRRNNQRLAEQRQVLQGAQQDLLAELSVLADDVLRLEPEIAMRPAARPDYEAAVSRYRWLEAAIPQIDSPDDPPRIERAMAEARYAMARAQAIVRDLDPPAPPPELTHPGRYGEPAIEIDERDEYRRPRYAGYGGGWYGGGFFGGNDLFTGLLLGHMLGGFGGFGGGDFGGGGGDFGGGDFGGGDW
ncbi:MAG TPA: hypothetical protein VM345_16075 [Acidimicrobiales bacterium]|nr:hypothetical protein [Acidimicrobiales bacterium]